MNFIIRNLGWILLIVFFVFMLYLISNQNNTKDINLNTGTGIITEQSELLEEIKSEEKEEIVMVEEVKENIKKEMTEPSKVNKLDSKASLNIDDLVNKIDTISSEAEVVTLDGSTGGIMNSIRNFFTIKKQEALTDEIVISTGGVDEDLIAEVETELNGKETIIVDNVEEGVIEETVVKKEKKKSIFDFGFGKKKETNTGMVRDINNMLGLDAAKKKDKGIVKNKYKQGDIKIKDVKKIEKKEVASKDALETYEIGVKSMFLNNAWFTKRAGVLYKGDKVEQLTETNKYGCFKVKVLSSSNSTNNGKIAWACKYYMIGHQASLNSYKVAASAYYKNINKKVVSKKVVKKVAKKSIKAPSNTKVGTLHKIATHSLKLNNKDFTQSQAFLLKGDTVEQLTNINSQGCFKASVYKSMNSYSTGKTGWVCQKYLK